MKVSIVIPILNEQNSIRQLLVALTKQSVQPSEVILVDGGSTDQTLSLIEAFRQSTEFPIKVLESPSSNRSQARNLGIHHAQHRVIALTDAGCVPKKNWLEKLTSPFIEHPKSEVVAGFYDPAVANAWQDLVANVTSVRTWNFNPKTFLPSSRSIALTKEIWQKVGGYPEYLETCEDLVFAEQLKKQAQHWQVVKDAQVVWRQENSLARVCDKIYNYALGDLQANHERHVNKINAAWWRIVALLVVALPLLFAQWWWLKSIGLGLFILYIVGTWWKHRRTLWRPLAWVYAVLIQLAVDFSLVQAWVYHKMNQQE